MKKKRKINKSPSVVPAAPHVVVPAAPHVVVPAAPQAQ